MINYKNPMVSIVMITYGHENYIQEAINGVFMQQTDFNIELIIANDCSPDNTDEVVQNILSTVPENITVKYMRHRKNMGMIPNFIWALSQVRGKYIALCEGDDYWTDSLKLQTQINLLEEYNVGFSFHAAETVHYDHVELQNDKSTYFHGDKIKVLAITDVINNKGQAIRTPLASFVFKKELLDKLKSQYPTFYRNNLTHSFITLWAAYCTKLLYIPKYMSIYRHAHDESWTHKMKSDVNFKKEYSLQVIRSYSAFNQITQLEFNSLFNKNINTRIFSVLKNNKIPFDDRKGFFKETIEYVNSKNKILWFLIFKRKNVHHFVNWLFKNYRQLSAK